MSAIEIEDALLKHPDVREVGAIGVPDALRGQVVKAFVVADAQRRRRVRQGDPGPRARAAQPARISAPRRVRAPSCPRRRPARSTARCCATEANSRRTLRCHEHDARRSFPKITEEGLDDLRQRIGVKIGQTAEPWCHEATRDNIRHYAHGIGDDNPLWCDARLRRRRRSSATSIALPSFLFATSRIISGYVGGLPGIHAMWSGSDWNWHKHGQPQRRDHDRGPAQGPDRARDQVRRPRGAADLPRRFLQPEGRPGRRGRQLVLPHRARPRARAGHQVQGAARRSRVRRYTDEELADAYKLYAEEKIRGAETRYWEDVKEGEALPTHGQGPDDGHRLHRLRAGLGRPLHPRQQARLEAASTRTPASASRTASTSPTVPSACTGKRSSRSKSARPAPTITAPSAAPGSRIT